MWKVVTSRGYGKPKCSFENIHLLYKDIIVAKKNLFAQISRCVHLNLEQTRTMKR
jgi:hypothetical protein